MICALVEPRCQCARVAALPMIGWCAFCGRTVAGTVIAHTETDQIESMPVRRTMEPSTHQTWTQIVHVDRRNNRTTVLACIDGDALGGGTLQVQVQRLRALLGGGS